MPRQIFLATKFGNHVTPAGGREIRNEPEYILGAVEESLKRLGTNYIDLLYWYAIINKVDHVAQIGLWHIQTLTPD